MYQDPKDMHITTLNIELAAIGRRIASYEDAAASAERSLQWWEGSLTGDPRLVEEFVAEHGGHDGVRAIIDELHEYVTICRWHAKVTRKKELAEVIEAVKALEG